MSAIEFMKNGKILKLINERVQKPILKEDRKILVPPISKNQMLIGTAFDYLLRFYIERNNKIGNKAKWISENVMDIYKLMPDNKKFFKKIMSRARENHDRYVKNGILSNDLLESIVYISEIDGICRTGGITPLDISFQESDIQELKKLYSVIPDDIFKTMKKCYLNPSFGLASESIGGGDADIIIGNTLVDIKTTRIMDFKDDYFRQLLCYYILNILGGIDGSKTEVKIDKLGIYFSRYAYLFSFDVKDIAKEEDIEKLTDLFLEIAKSKVV